VSHADGAPDRRWARKLALWDYAERIAGLGSWEWTPATDELLWSDNVFRLFGFEPGEVTPTPDLVMTMVNPGDRVRVKESLTALAGGTFDGRGFEYRSSRADGRVRTFRITAAAPAAEAASSPPRLVGSLEDVTLQRRIDRQLAAHVAVTRSLDEWASLDDAEHLLENLAAALELPFGVFWVPEGSSLGAQAIWHSPSADLEAVAEGTWQWRPGLGSATVGRAFRSRQPMTFDDASDGSPPARRRSILGAGLAGAVVVPAVFADQTLAVIEFLTYEPPVFSQGLVRVLDGIGHELGYFLSHRRGELTESVLTPRQLEVLQLAAQGRSAAAIATQLHLSRATVKRHFERAYAALEVSDRAAAVGEAMRRGLIT
jgi:DNA-binding CsgD family transcriptional regulator